MQITCIFLKIVICKRGHRTQNGWDDCC